MKKRKILITISNLGGGGAEKGLVTFLKTFDRELLDVEVLLYQKSGPYVKDIPDDITYYFLGLGKDYIKQGGLLGKITQKYEKKKYKYFRNNPRTLYNKIVGNDYDLEVTYIHNLMPYTQFSPIAKKIGWVRNDLSSKNYMNKKMRESIIRASHKFDRIVCVSNDAKKSFVEMGGDEDKAVVIYNPIDTSIIRQTLNNCPPQEKNMPFTFILIGRLAEQKRIDRLIKAVYELKQDGKNCRIILVGDGPLEAELKRQVADLDLTDTIIFTGFVKNPFCLLESADCYISCSDHEGFSLTTAEAMILHKPIIATPTNGPRELLQDGKLGMLIEPNVNSLKLAMKKMMEDERFRDSYKKQLEKENFPFVHKNIVQQMQDLFVHI